MLVMPPLRKHWSENIINSEQSIYIDNRCGFINPEIRLKVIQGSRELKLQDYDTI